MNWKEKKISQYFTFGLEVGKGLESGFPFAGREQVQENAELTCFSRVGLLSLHRNEI